MIKVGIQGEIGSSNFRAAHYFASRCSWNQYEIIPLCTTNRVLTALHEGSIEFGTFAWESSRAGLVTETQEAIQNYQFTKLEEVKLEIDHALLSRQEIDLTAPVKIFSHPQALKEHKIFLKQKFPCVEFFDEAGTAYAAQRLQGGEYPENSLVIAPKGCADVYDLQIYSSDLPSNKGYWTRFFLVSQ